MENHIHGGDVYRHPGMVDFSSNCNPFGTPEGVKRAVRLAAEEISHYPDVECEELRRALSCHTGIEEGHIVCGNGAADLIFALAMAVRPKKALMTAPTFAEYAKALKAAGCQVEYIFTSPEKDFRPDDEFIRAIDEDTDMVFLCNPNNPTGNLLEREFVGEILSRCEKYQSVLALDECFMDFVETPEQYTMKGAIEQHGSLFMLKAFTKLYGMAGIRLGYGLCSDEALMRRIGDVTQPWNVSTPAQKAGIAALEEKEYAARSVAAVAEERKFLAEGLKELGFKVYEPSANYVFFYGPKGLAERTMEQGIMIRDCSNYEGLSEGYYRVAVKLHEENRQLLQVLLKISED